MLTSDVCLEIVWTAIRLFADWTYPLFFFSVLSLVPNQITAMFGFVVALIAFEYSSSCSVFLLMFEYSPSF